MSTTNLVNITRTTEIPPSGDVVTRDRLVRSLANDREQFIAAVRSGELYRLAWIKFKIIDGCNIKCVMCNHWRREEYLRSFLTHERLLSLGNELAELGTRHVNWSGGEPTLRKDLPEIIGHYRTLGIKCSLITNGTRLTEEYAGRLCEARLDTVLLSLESTNPDVHDKVVGSPDAWRKLIDGVTYLRRSGSHSPSLSFTTVLTSINVGPALPGLVPLASRLGVAQVRFTPVGVSHLKPEERALLPTPEQIERLRKEYLPEMLEMGRHLGVKVHVDGGDSVGPDETTSTLESNSAARISADGDHAQGYYSNHACYLPFYHCLVDWRGHVFACCHMDYDGFLGSIAETPLIEVLQSDLARRLRHRLTSDDVPPSCQDCVMQIAENQQIDKALSIEADTWR